MDTASITRPGKVKVKENPKVDTQKVKVKVIAMVDTTRATTDSFNADAFAPEL